MLLWQEHRLSQSQAFQYGWRYGHYCASSDKLDELGSAIFVLLNQLNHRLLKKLPGSPDAAPAARAFLGQRRVKGGTGVHRLLRRGRQPLQKKQLEVRLGRALTPVSAVVSHLSHP